MWNFRKSSYSPSFLVVTRNNNHIYIYSWNLIQFIEYVIQTIIERRGIHSSTIFLVLLINIAIILRDLLHWWDRGLVINTHRALVLLWIFGYGWCSSKCLRVFWVYTSYINFISWWWLLVRRFFKVKWLCILLLVYIRVWLLSRSVYWVSLCIDFQIIFTIIFIFLRILSLLIVICFLDFYGLIFRRLIICIFSFLIILVLLFVIFFRVLILSNFYFNTIFD